MSISSLPLSYCTNVHPAQTVAEVLSGLDTYTVNVARAFDKPLAAGLWLARSVATEVLAKPDGIGLLRAALSERALSCHTLNAFPYGDFHSTRVKENVYLPDWSTRNRLQYTQDCATILAALLPDSVEGSISTLPLGFKGFDHRPGFLDFAAGRLVEVVSFLRKLRDRTGRTVRLAIEPEPFCLLETTPETIAFFETFWKTAERSKLGDVARDLVGVCFDVCHQAVEFEDVSDSIALLTAKGIRINKVHLSCALELRSPMANSDGRAALKHYVEERYLHQTIGRVGDGLLARSVDLSPALIETPPPDFVASDVWRVHFHVPVDADTVGPLHTTRPQLREAIDAVAKLPYAPHLEVETYTWGVLPGSDKPDLVAGLARELTATTELLSVMA